MNSRLSVYLETKRKNSAMNWSRVKSARDEYGTVSSSRFHDPRGRRRSVKSAANDHMPRVGFLPPSRAAPLRPAIMGREPWPTTVVAWTTEPYRKTKAARADLEPRLNVSEADSSLHLPRWGDSTREHRSKWRCVSLSLINRYEEGDLENFPSSGAILKIKKNSWGCMWEIHRVF